jgi:cyclic pyranopterin phosphate synthase
MPKEVFGMNFNFLPHHELLTFEQLVRTARIFAHAGVTKIRITGGEPLLRRELAVLIQMLSEIRGIKDIALTTNGSLLTKDYAMKLKNAGLKRISISLDALDDQVFAKINNVDFPVSRVLEAIGNAQAAGLNPIKINMVVKRGVNEGEILKMADHFRNTPIVLRFIEFMDVGNNNGWQMKDVITANEVLQLIQSHWPVELLPSTQPGEVANRFRYKDGAGEFGIIASVTKPFCTSCNRARLSSNGKLYTCLFAHHGHDVRSLLRSGKSDQEILDFIKNVWNGRSDRYSLLRTELTGINKDGKNEMHFLGG